MSKSKDRAKQRKHMHGALLVFWVLLIVPTLLLGWYKSIPYLVFISMYANIASHAAGWSADSE